MKITHCKLSKKVQKRLLEFFVLEVTARSAADLLQIHPNSAALFYHKIRLVIEYHLNLEAKELFDGEIELDESYFGGIHKGKRGRGAGSKTAVFGLLKRNGKVFVVVVKDTKTNTLMPIITSKIKPDSIVYTDCYKSYNALDVSDFKHFRINHSKEFAKDHNHINGIENFWSQAKRVLRKYNGIDKKHFHLFIKECEFRFNYGTPSNQLKVLRRWCGI
ncbi:IS1595 family transposase [Moraxella sp. FZLJ2107]|uniref:IS1595 family transposase n=1 Tax=unclassified Moraxella TaxID=2685852 RepID=UPI0020C8B4E1|nr:MULTISPECIES: IS1595 family transposase [unclassified Moraxella]UTO04454.1 IS1595 family transposase [Moraxella sp. FZLJ2107]UTO05027.1 IS1595 family transposase [Moraxella sp. FZLJ2107]UTO05515.1 IS1595 family transposase [Moraxella sp. FZLJ2107]UTO21762.1 IS1595 family transposase [Moraxella sp. FZLJ2109]UTO22251.1 IS1595 family transposase [Moraxella sp. FZLJ2109]